jgi:hypothetical protein
MEARLVGRRVYSAMGLARPREGHTSTICPAAVTTAQLRWTLARRNDGSAP